MGIDNYYRCGNIAEIYKGKSYYITNKMMKNDDSTEVQLLNWKHIKEMVNEKKITSPFRSVRIIENQKNQNHYLEKGDIVFPVFPSKEKVEVIYIEDKPKEKYLFDESVLVMRITDTDIDARYIYIMLNSIPIQKALIKLISEKRTKTCMARLTKEILSLILIVKMTKEKRKKIIEEYTRLKDAQDEFSKTLIKEQTIDKDKSAVIWLQ